MRVLYLHQVSMDKPTRKGVGILPLPPFKVTEGALFVYKNLRMRISTVCFLILLLVQDLNAQQSTFVKVTGQVLPDNGLSYVPDKPELRIVPYNEAEAVITTTVDSVGKFSADLSLKMPGAYELRYKNFKMSMLLSPAEPVYQVTIKCDEKQEVKSMRITGSRENDAYRIFKRENTGFKDLLRDVKTACADGKNCAEKLRKQFAAQNELMEYLKSGYKGTYVATTLASLGEVPDLNGTGSILGQMQAGFFDAVNFKDSMLYRTPDLTNKISWYLDYVADTSAPARISFIRHLMDKTKGSHFAQKSLLTVLFNSFLDDYRESYAQSLVQWANAEPGLADAQAVLAAKLKLVANVLPGQPAPDVTGQNLKQQTQTLLNTVKENKLTLLIFWESDCPHCRKAMPGFISLYKKYHPKGLEVFAASLDNDTSKWHLFIDYNHLTWTNIVLPTGSSAHADYFIQYTPTAVLIDHSGHIIRRFVSVDDLEKDISAVLVK